MELLRPHLLAYLWLVPVAALVAVWAERRRRARLARAAGTAFALRRGLAATKAALVVVALALLVVALAGPRWGYQWAQVRHRGSDLVVAVDVSKSMLARDIEPSRLGRARRELLDLLAVLKSDRVGLVAFAGDAFVECPLTEDYAAVRQYVEYLDPELIPLQGSDLGGAITESLKALAAGGEGGGAGRAIVLLSDGEDLEGHVAAAAAAARAKGVKIYTVGLGTAEGGPIPEPLGGVKKDRSGNVVVTHANEASLQRLALETGGIYARSVAGQGTLPSLYLTGIRPAETPADVRTSREKLWFERFQWFLALALLCLVVEPWLRDAPAAVRAGSGLLLAAALALPAASPAAAQTLEEARQAFEKGDFAGAARGFADAEAGAPGRPEHAYNRGVSQYRQGDYAGAAAGFAKAAESSAGKDGDKALAEQSLFNLGNSQASLGKLDDAIKSYEKALALRPDDQEAKENLAYVKQAKEQQQNQPQQNQPQQGQPQQGQPQQGQPQQGQPQQGQPQQNQSQQNQSQQGQPQQGQPQQGQPSQPQPGQPQQGQPQQGQPSQPQPGQPQQGQPQQGQPSQPQPGQPSQPQQGPQQQQPGQPQPQDHSGQPQPAPPGEASPGQAQAQPQASPRPSASGRSDEAKPGEPGAEQPKAQAPPPARANGSQAGGQEANHNQSEEAVGAGTAAAAKDPHALSQDEAERILRSVNDNVKRFLFAPSKKAPPKQLDKDW